MKFRKDRSFFHFFLLLVFCFFFLFLRIGDYSLKEPDEGRYAEIAREMLEVGDWLVPRLNYLPYFEKPPLFFWVTGFFYKIFGISEFSFRFSNLAFSTLCVLALYFFSMRWVEREASFFSALILLSSFGFLAMSRIVTLDMAFCALLTLSVFSFNSFYLEGKKAFLWCFYLFCALATLVKGFAAPLLLAITVIIFLWREKNLSFLKEMRIFRGIIIYSLIVGPYFIYMSATQNSFFYFFFIDQHILRYLTSKHQREGPIYYFVPLLFAGAFPFSAFIPRAFVEMRKKREIRFLILWILVVLIFFSLSGSKLPPYILPVFPSLSLILGTLFFSHEKKNEAFHPERIVYSIVFFVLSILAFFMCFCEGGVTKNLFHFFVGLSLASFFVFALLLAKKKWNSKSLFLILFAFSSFFVLLTLTKIDVIDSLRTTKSLAQVILKEKKPDDMIANYRTFDRTLLFYCKSPITVVEYRGELDFGLRHFGSKSHFMNEEEFVEILKTKRRVFCVLKKKNLTHLKEKAGETVTLRLCEADRCLVTNF